MTTAARRLFSFCLVASLLVCLAAAQSPAPAQSAVVPRLVNFTGKATDAQGKPITGIAGITFSIYTDQYEGAPLWLETQNVTADSKGNYTVQLGATKPDGLPLDLFTSGEARWLGVTINGGQEQPRVLLLSVPYALKAADAQTLGGLPPSAFLLAGAANTAAQSNASDSVQSSPSPDSSSDVTTTGGSANTLPMFTTATNIQNSAITQTGTGSTAKVGINTTTPASALDVKGSGTIRGTLSLPPTATATSTTGYDSQAFTLAASAFNTSSNMAAKQTFQWQAEPVGNDTTTTSGTLNLLFAEGSAKPTATGLSVGSNGQINFASGQTFPGTGDGTITSVTAGTGLSGGGTSGSVSLSLASNSCAAGNAITALPFTCSPFATLGANTFTGHQTVNGNLSATGVVTGSSYQIGSNLFAFGSYAKENAFLGFAGNTTTTGVDNMAVGPFALYSNTSGNANTASGQWALESNTTGSYNTASGEEALYSNTTGTLNTAIGNAALTLNTTGADNTAVGGGALFNNTASDNAAFGYEALYYNTTGSNNAAFGYQALYSDALNNQTGISNAAFGYQALYSNTTGGANTASGAGALYSNSAGIWNTATGASALYDNGEGGENTANGVSALSSNTYGSYNTASGGESGYINDDSPVTGSYNTFLGYLTSMSTGSLSNATAIGACALVSANNALALGGVGCATTSLINVGIDVSNPSNILTVLQGGGNAIADGWSTYSSRRWKTNIQTLPDALAKVEQLRGVSYDLKDSGKHEIGVIAEEVGKVVPEVVSFEANGKDARGVDYSRLTALLIEAVKQQQRQIAAQQSQIRKQQRLMMTQQDQIAGLSRKVGVLESSLRQAEKPAVVALK
jgi:hypothetical protein